MRRRGKLCPSFDTQTQQVADRLDAANVGIRQTYAQALLQQYRQLHPPKRIEVEIESEVEVQVERLAWIALPQQGPHRVRGRVAQQRRISRRRGVDGTFSASGHRLLIE